MLHSYNKLPQIGILFLFLFFPYLLCAQVSNIRYGAATSGYAGTHNQLPFWMYANTDGVVDGGSVNFISHFYSHYTSVDTTKSLRLQTGFDVATRLASDKTLFFRELYGRIGYKFLNLNVGRFYDPIGLMDDNLTMGSMMVSRNATPVPKIQLLTNGFTNIPFTQGYLQFKAMFSHGWLESDRYVKNAYLHQKYLYLKINYKRFEGMGGLIHNVVWGGTHPKYGKLPSSFSDFISVLTGSAASADSNAPQSDISNAIGNSVAAYDFRANLNFDEFQLKAYRMFYLEDRVSTRFRSPWAGVWGAGIEWSDGERFVNNILYEHLNTKRQDAFDFQPRGRASYYNNGIYRSGWSYEGRVLGNPLLLFGPNANFAGGRSITNNIIIAHHIGIKGKPGKRFFYKAFLTYSRNYGTKRDQTLEDPFVPLSEIRVDEFSTMLKVKYLMIPQYGLSLTSSLAFDVGELYGDNRLGFQLGIQWDRIAR